MSGLGLLSCVFILFLLAYFCYGAFLKKAFGIDNSRPCPSITKQDGIDYSPTHPSILFGHHFASIAGAGPIVGPIAAAYLGWGPAILWIVLGCICIGAMHDFAALFLSVRNEGRSIAFIVEQELGYIGRQLFLLFCFFTLILVVTVFTIQVADTFIITPSVATASLLFILISPSFGILTSKNVLSLTEGSLIFVPILFALVWLGTVIPLDLGAITGMSPANVKTLWCVFLLYYAYCASVLPVWFLLQPRDYLNSFLLYAMIILGLGGVIAYRPDIQAPAFAINGNLTPGVFPLLFVTIACGACSGFHALVASGTSSKQIAKESHILPVGYGAMLIEGLLATLALISVCFRFTDMQSFSELIRRPPVAFADGLATFVVKLGIPLPVGKTFMSLAISAFMLTSLDTATRLARFIWQELVLPSDVGASAPSSALPQALGSVRAFFSSRWIATLVIILLSGWLITSGEGIAIWPVFGSSNQLLAALTLLAVSLWLIRHKKPVLFALLPMFFMIICSGWAIINLIIQNIKTGNVLLGVVAILMAVMAVLLLIISIQNLNKSRKAS